MANMTRIGYGQVEPNHLSAQRTGQIYAQLPADSSIKVLENGQFVKYDYANGKVNFTGKGEWMLVFNEVKLYDGAREHYKDFAMREENYTEGSKITHEGYGPFEGRMVPRVFKTNIGDIYTTNCLGVANNNNNAKVDMGEDTTVNFAVGKLLKVNESGYLVAEAAEIGESVAPMLWEIVKVYTLPDGQAALKIMRVK